MKKLILTSSYSLALAAVLLLAGHAALADTVTGNLSTGISATNGSTVNGIVVAPPAATPAAGVYDSAQSVRLDAPGSTSVLYTTDGTAPSCTTGTTYSGAISVDSSQVIEAISCYPGSVSSTVAAYQYAINPPSIVPPENGGVTLSGGGGGGGGSISLFSKGDANGDSHVNILDFVTLMANWGQTGTGNQADFNSDGSVGILDFVTLMANWTN